MESPKQSQIAENSEATSSWEKIRLLELENTGLYVFHGSGDIIDELEPRQAIDSIKGPDGEPAVFTSPKIDYAIFMAIVNKFNCPRGSYSNGGAVYHDDGSYDLKFGVTKDTWEQLRDDATGHVYVFDKTKSNFKPREGHQAEWISHEVVRPLMSIQVYKRDLPRKIEIGG